MCRTVGRKRALTRKQLDKSRSTGIPPEKLVWPLNKRQCCEGPSKKNKAGGLVWIKGGERRQLDTGRDLNNKNQKTAIKGALGSIRDSECNLSIKEVNYYELS